MQCKQRVLNSKTESTRKARDQKHCNRMKSTFGGLISLDTSEEPISELEEMARVLLLEALNIKIQI